MLIKFSHHPPPMIFCSQSLIWYFSYILSRHSSSSSRDCIYVYMFMVFNSVVHADDFKDFSVVFSGVVYEPFTSSSAALQFSLFYSKFITFCFHLHFLVVLVAPFLYCFSVMLMTLHCNWGSKIFLFKIQAKGR